MSLVLLSTDSTPLLVMTTTVHCLSKHTAYLKLQHVYVLSTAKVTLSMVGGDQQCKRNFREPMSLNLMKRAHLRPRAARQTGEEYSCSHLTCMQPKYDESCLW